MMIKNMMKEMVKEMMNKIKTKRNRGQGERCSPCGCGQSPRSYFSIFVSLVMLLFASPAAFSDELTRSYDLVVVGAGTGGSAAAIQAARSGLSVAVLEESDFVGGQIAGAAVSTMDDLGLTRSGIYGEYIERVHKQYAALGVAMNICLWGADTIAVEPSAARDILTGMMTETGRVDIYLRTEVTEAVKKGDALLHVHAREQGRDGYKNLTFKAANFIEATEYGDLLPLVGARYRVGNSISPAIDMDANVQDITYVAVVRKYKEGAPAALKMTVPPSEYEKYAEKFRRTIVVNGSSWPGTYPFNVPVHNAYRALPDPENRSEIVGDDPATWGRITKTCINWANDYPDRGGSKPGLSVRYIEDRAYRKSVEREAMKKTLAFIWYMQSELGMKEWSVDSGQGYGGYFSNGWDGAHDPDLSGHFAPLLRFFPPFPYVREGRRAVGAETLKQADIVRDKRLGRAEKHYTTGVALGEYPVDVHGSHLDRYMEHDLGESEETFPRTWEERTGVFQVPLGVLIPERVDGLILAEKNISVSRMVNGAIRLQPITMHTGQAAGAIAAESVRSGRRAREVDAASVQRALIDAGCWIAPDICEDAARGGRYWGGVQLASLSGALGKRIKISRNHFGIYMPIRRAELASVINALYHGREQGLPKGDMYVPRSEFADWLVSAGLISRTRISEIFAPYAKMDMSLERGEAVSILYELTKK